LPCSRQQVIVTALDGGRPAVNAFFKRIVDWRIGAGWWAFIVLALPTATVILALIFGDTFNPPSIGELAKEVGGFFFGFLLVNWWEESSWAGFMQTRLEQRHNLFVSAALTAIPFAGITCRFSCSTERRPSPSSSPTFSCSLCSRSWSAATSG
jgi:membrane protease YdiL (CAAX protease family)